MSAPLRILIVSNDPWRDDSSEGSVFSAFFSGQPFTVANICCKPGQPQSDLCTAYYQLTDRMAFRNVFKGEPTGVSFSAGRENPGGCGGAEHSAPDGFISRSRLEVFHTARQLLWRFADYDNASLRRFVSEFAPDIVFAPLCSERSVLDIQRCVIDLAKCPAVTCINDDVYSLRQVRFSPLYWLDRFALRAGVRSALNRFACAYTLTEEQADAIEKMLGIKPLVLHTCIPLPEPEPVGAAKDGPVRFVYAGELCHGREKTLLRIAQACKKYGARLDIYTDTAPGKRAAAVLNDRVSSFVHDAAPRKHCCAAGDVVVYAESFRIKHRQRSRLTFSGEIADCLGCGCAVLAVGAASSTGIRYLHRTGAALRVDRLSGVEDAVRSLACDPAAVRRYAANALACVEKNHDLAKNRLQLRNELLSLRRTGMLSLDAAFAAEGQPDLPLISVVLPVHDVEPYIDKCMEHLLKQTYRNLDIILVDDGSPDNCPAICDAYAARDARVRVIHKQNEGVSVARNVGISAAYGKYITFIDSDDYTTDDMIEVLYRTMVLRNADISICGMREVKPDETPAESSGGNIVTLSDGQSLETMLYQKLFYTAPWAKLVKTEIARAHLFPPHQRYEDMATTYLWLADVDTVAVNTATKYYYVQHVGSFMGRAFSDERFVQLDTSERVYDFIKRYYPEILPAARARRFAVYCQVLLQMPENVAELHARRFRMLETMRQDARSVALDSQCRRKDHYGAVIFRIAGEAGLKRMWRFTMQ